MSCAANVKGHHSWLHACKAAASIESQQAPLTRLSALGSCTSAGSGHCLQRRLKAIAFACCCLEALEPISPFAARHDSLRPEKSCLCGNSCTFFLCGRAIDSSAPGNEKRARSRGSCPPLQLRIWSRSFSSRRKRRAGQTQKKSWNQSRSLPTNWFTPAGVADAARLPAS